MKLESWAISRINHGGSLIKALKRTGEKGLGTSRTKYRKLCRDFGELEMRSLTGGGQDEMLVMRSVGSPVLEHQEDMGDSK